MKRYLMATLVVLSAISVIADTQYHISNPIFHVDNDYGEPASGWYLKFYAADSTTPKAVFTTSIGDVTHEVEVELDSSGNAEVYGNGSYKIEIYNSNDVLKDSIDNIVISRTITDFAETFLDDSTAKDMRATLGLGSASILDASNGALDVVQLDSQSRLPAVDASQLIGLTTSQVQVLPRSYLAGFTLSNSGLSDLSISAGACRDVNDATNILLNGTIIKEIDNTWAAGTSAGGRNDALIASTWYHVYVISNATDEDTDVIFSLQPPSSMTTADIPTGYTHYRRIGSVITDATSTGIVEFHQYGDEFYWDVPKLGYTNDALAEQTDTLVDVDFVPAGINTKVDLIYKVKSPTSGNLASALSVISALQSIPQIYLDAWATWGNYFKSAYGGTETTWADGSGQYRFDSTGKVRLYGDTSATAASVFVRIYVTGWVDTRGRDD